MLSTQSGFSENVYLQAAPERIRTARRLLGDAPVDFVGASYFAGVAVECLFSAYRMRAGADDTGRHDVRLQAANGGFYDAMTRRERIYYGELVDDIAARWQNNHRYRSENSLREYVTKNRLYVIQGSQTTRTDALVWSTTRPVDRAQEVIDKGLNQWPLPIQNP